MPLIKEFRNTIRKYGLIGKGERIVVAVSGGPDSMALLHAMNALRREAGLKLCIAHLDHMLRPGSGRDMEFVRTAARNLKIDFFTAKINVRNLSRTGSIEETARNARHYFLIQAAKAFGAKKIALAHTLDDQAETVLMRILRGSGLYGLSGIAPKRRIYGVEMVRPLIDTPRSAVMKFLRKHRIKFLTDPTNTEEIFLRNKVRHKLIPFLEKNFSRNIKVLLARLAETSACDYDRLLRESEVVMRRFGRGIDLRKFSRLHPSLQRMVLRSAIQRLKGDLRRIDLQHLRELEDLVLNRPVGSVVDLPQGISAIKKPKTLVFFSRKNQ